MMICRVVGSIVFRVFSDGQRSTRVSAFVESEIGLQQAATVQKGFRRLSFHSMGTEHGLKTIDATLLTDLAVCGVIDFWLPELADERMNWSRLTKRKEMHASHENYGIARGMIDDCAFPAIEAADAMTKAAEVGLISREFVGGGRCGTFVVKPSADDPCRSRCV